jgi:hypothetical protein
MSEWKQIIVQAVRNAPDEVILDLVRGRLGIGSAVGASTEARAKGARGPAANVPLGRGVLVFHGREQLSVKTPSGDLVSVASGASTRLLHHLALARKADEARSAKPSATGWRASTDVAKALGIKIAHLNVLSYRARGALAKAGLEGVIERHQPTASMRLAVPASSIKIID